MKSKQSVSAAIQCQSWNAQSVKEAGVAVGLLGVPEEAPAGLHVGLLYQARTKARVLHLAWHHLLKDEEPEGEWRLVVPGLDRDLLRVALSHCRNASKKLGAQIPYGLRYARSELIEVATGKKQKGMSLVMGPGETGLTCATFVLALLKMAGIDLLDLASWEQRDEQRRKEDEAEQAKLVALLHKHGAAKQANAITQGGEIGSLRYRPEEVSAASGLESHPVAYSQAQPEGDKLRRQILSPTPKPTPVAPTKKGKAQGQGKK